MMGADENVFDAEGERERASLRNVNAQQSSATRAALFLFFFLIEKSLGLVD